MHDHKERAGKNFREHGVCTFITLNKYTRPESYNMASTEINMGPLQARFILKALVATGQKAEFVSLYVSSSNSNSGRLSIRSCDGSGTCLYEITFGPSYFDSLTSSGEGSFMDNRVALYSSRLLVRLFKNVPAAKIIHIKLILSMERIELQFFWRTGLVTRRVLRSVEPPDDCEIPKSISCTPNSTVPILSFSPKYIQNLIQLFPDSSTLWALTIRRKPGSANTLLLTNAIPGVDAGSTVELTVSQSDLNRNGSYFSRSLCTLCTLSLYCYVTN